MCTQENKTFLVFYGCGARSGDWSQPFSSIELTAGDASDRPPGPEHLPNLVLQEVHVAVEQGVGWREDAHGLHAGATLQLTLYGHVGKAGQSEKGPLPEVAGRKHMQNMDKRPLWGYF